MIGAKRAKTPSRRFRLYLVTDAVLSARAKSIEPSGYRRHSHGVPYLGHAAVPPGPRVGTGSRTARTGCCGTGALQASLRSRSLTAIGDITTYLAAVPGGLLASLYRQHGSRLLEGNVRSFLTIRGKINRGYPRDGDEGTGPFPRLQQRHQCDRFGSRIRVTVLIASITDLQIVNGGQTTASLFYATQASRGVALDDVFVQMKLVIVSADKASEMVPLISRYANSQNAVREDDFFSNSPFHVRMEELSKRVLAPPRPVVNYQTKWYYERTRGQYLNERNRRSVAEQKKFEAEFPQPQVITKTDAAKYVVTWETAAAPSQRRRTEELQGFRRTRGRQVRKAA